MRKILVRTFSLGALIGVLAAAGCGGEEKSASAYCCINKQYYSCSDQGAQKCAQTLGSDTSGCAREATRDTQCN